jgi:cytochrome oxidase assembly protein ShyY1
MDRAAVERAVGAPVTPFYVVLEPPPGDPPPGRPVRVPPPSLDEGPHRSYAIQWFFFALLAVVGAVTFAQSERGRAGQDSTYEGLKD